MSWGEVHKYPHGEAATSGEIWGGPLSRRVVRVANLCDARFGAYTRRHLRPWFLGTMLPRVSFPNVEIKYRSAAGKEVNGSKLFVQAELDHGEDSVEATYKLRGR